jgi:hypothetical protein
MIFLVFILFKSARLFFLNITIKNNAVFKHRPILRTQEQQGNWGVGACVHITHITLGYKLSNFRGSKL